MGFLKNHPFAVQALFEHSIVLTYALPYEHLIPFVPECLQLDTLNDRWAFLAVAMVQTRHLRPAGFPAFLGNDFFLIGYRIFVRYEAADGRRLRGLYILHSQTDKRIMELLGNTFTHYRYTRTDISQHQEGSLIRIDSQGADLHVAVEPGGEDYALPKGSPFSDWKEARRFAGPLPFTFSYLKNENKTLIVEGRRENWIPQPLRVYKHQVGFVNKLGLGDAAVLANAFMIRNIPYLWKKGRKESWKH